MTDYSALPIIIPQPELTDFCKRWSVQRLSLFGSVLRDDFAPESDVDVLIIFLPEATPTYFDLHDMKEELTMLIGRHVDLLTLGAISPYFRDTVLREAVDIYGLE
jgi:uncharacterized protein